MAKSSNGNGHNGKHADPQTPMTAAQLAQAVAGKAAGLASLEQSRRELQAEREALEAALPGLRVAVHVEGDASRADELKQSNTRLLVIADSLSGFDFHIGVVRAELAALEAEHDAALAAQRRAEMNRLRAQLADQFDALLAAPLNDLAGHVVGIHTTARAIDAVSGRRSKPDIIEGMVRNLVAEALEAAGIRWMELATDVGAHHARAELEKMRAPAADLVAD